MWVQPFQSAQTEQVPPKLDTEHHVAVLLNGNARRVNDKVRRLLSHVVPEGDLYFSRSELDARRIATQVLDRRYDTVFLGGGDGTVAGFVNEIMNQLEVRRRYHPVAAPKFGVLKLGTGNSMASVVRASPMRGDGILDDVLRARAGEVPGFKSVELLLVDGKRAPFAGVGLDGQLLNDYVWVKNTLGKGPLAKVMSGGSGYFTSVAFKTVPHYLVNSNKVHCEVWNGQQHAAYRIGPDGLPKGEPIPKGGLIFKGELMMAAASTIPYYGFELKMFPFAGKRRGMMNLRLGVLPTVKILANLKGLWNGTWLPEGLMDFHCSDATIKFARPMPFQIAGDAEGYRDEVRFEMAKEPIELLDFTGAVN